MDMVITIIIGLIGGISVGIQSPLSGAISKRVGGTASSFIVHVSGAILSGLLLLARGGEGIREWRTLPWWMFGAGVFGVILYLTLNHTLPRLGAGGAVALLICGQLIISLIIDNFGLLEVAVRPIEPTRILAVLLLLAGGYLMVK